MNPRQFIRRHLSFANVVACTALFVALGGSAYAASGKINGNNIKRESIGAGKLKKATITSNQIKPGTLNASVIDVSSLGTVPSAQTAVSATSAASADRANSANTANSATRASSADSADRSTSAETAGHADSAENAEHAEAADYATSAGNAATVGGRTAAQLTIACPTNTALFGGMCWDVNPRPIAFWIVANEKCAKAGGRLPSLGELIAYALQPDEPNEQVGPDQTWSGDVAELDGGKVEALTSSETARGLSAEDAVQLGYRCLFYRTN